MSLPLCLSTIQRNLSLVIAVSFLMAGQTTAARMSDPAVEAQFIEAGIFGTGLTPRMPEDSVCPGITVGFGSLYTYRGKIREKRNGYIHTGTDWAMPKGTPVVAIADGRVSRRIEDLEHALGNHIVIKHTNVSSEYGNLSGLAVDQGQKVKRGQVIGYVGELGKRAVFVHLHLNVTGDRRIRVEAVKKNFKYRYDFLQFLSGDMTPIDPVKKHHRKVKVSYMDPSEKLHPPGAKVIWPFICQKKYK